MPIKLVSENKSPKMISLFRSSKLYSQWISPWLVHQIHLSFTTPSSGVSGSIKCQVSRINKLYKKSKMHWRLWGVSHLGLAKLVNCKQILGHVADQDSIGFIDSDRSPWNALWWLKISPPPHSQASRECHHRRALYNPDTWCLTLTLCAMFKNDWQKPLTKITYIRFWP